MGLQRVGQDLVTKQQQTNSSNQKIKKETITFMLSHISHVRLSVTPWTVAYQAPPSMGFSRQEYWSGLPFPSPMHESEK